jgi:uncharacterized protein YkwD
MNRVRTAHGLKPLVADSRLESAARGHTEWMLRTGQLSHEGFVRRITRSRAAGPTFGEDLAWGTGSLGSPSAIVDAWMASPSHRRNLLRPGFHRVGLGQLTGSFAGHSQAVVVTADFAGR